MSTTFKAPSGWYGRIWQRMYEGSLAGTGAEVFTVWPYVIANMAPHPDFGAAVDLNPKLLAAKIGCDEAFILEGIRRLCEPDSSTRNGEEDEGRRLVHLSGMMYRVVTGEDYMKFRSREQAAERQRRRRERLRVRRKSQKQVQGENESREKRFVDAAEREDQQGMDEIAAEGL